MPTIHKRSQPDGSVRYLRDNGVFFLAPGYPGLSRREDQDHWLIRRSIRGKKYKLALPVSTLEAAKRLYVTFELDPEGFARSMRRRGPPDYKKLIEMYAQFLKVKEVKRPGIENTIRVLNAVQRLAQEQHLDMNSVSALSSFLSSRNLSRNTQRHYLAILKAFFGWCIRQDLLETNSVSIVGLPKGEETKEDRRRIITQEELDKVLDKIEVERHIYALMILWATGIRIDELNRYRIQDVSRSRMELMVARSKRGKTRYVPIPDLAIYNALVKFEKLRTKTGYPVMFRRYMDRLWERYPHLPRFTPHALRHSRITNWLAQGCSIYDVTRWAGHSSIKQTMAYVGELQQSHKRPDPTGWSYGKLELLEPSTDKDSSRQSENREGVESNILPERSA